MLVSVYALGVSVVMEYVMTTDDRIFRFGEIRSPGLMKDDLQVVGRSVGMALVGVAFFGGAGMLTGSKVGKEVKRACESMLLKINLTDIDMPCAVISYINKTVKKASNHYRKATSKAQETASCLEMILNAIDRERKVKLPSADANDRLVNSAGEGPVEKVEKLMEPLDVRALNQDEFDAKEKILGAALFSFLFPSLVIRVIVEKSSERQRR